MDAQPANSRPSKLWAYVALVVGGLLLLSGTGAAIGYLGLPFLAYWEDILGQQLGQMAGIFLGLVCGSLAVYHGLGSIRNRVSRPLKLPPMYLFWLTFAVVLGLGNVLLNFQVAEEFLFPPVFLLGAALPAVGVVAWATRRLGWPITWRQGALALVAGSTLSIFVAILLETVLPLLAFFLLAPLEFLAGSFGEVLASGAPGILERLLFSPLLIVFLMATALEAPIPEEFAKALGVTLFGRKRITTERQALMIGLASGAGFAILENMLYEGLYAQYSGWSWGGVTLLRGLGAVMHPVCTALVALGWFRAREGHWGQLLKAYLAAVGLHTLWNGGFSAFVYLTGLDYYGGLGWSFTIYGLAVELLLVVFLVALSLALWWLLRRLVTSLALEIEPDLAPTFVSPRALAAWAFACALVIIPIGAALGPAWGPIQTVVLAGPPAPTPTATAPGGWIAFRSDRHNNWEIYKMRADGSQVTRLTDNPAGDEEPCWSPDGNWIAFVSDRDENMEIYKMGADGSQVTRLTDDPASDWPSSWSPDGQWIAFVSYRDGNLEIYKMRANGSQVTNLTKNPAWDWQPSWSPDGNWIAFQSDHDGNAEIYKMRADGSEVTRLTDDPATDWQPSWSPDGNWIAFNRIRDGNEEIYVMRADGSEVTRLTYNRARDGYPSWSPDGTWIAFASDRDGNDEIYVMRADGSQVTRLTDNSAEDRDPSWGP